MFKFWLGSVFGSNPFIKDSTAVIVASHFVLSGFTILPDLSTTITMSAPGSFGLPCKVNSISASVVEPLTQLAVFSTPTSPGFKPFTAESEFGVTGFSIT